MARQVDGSIIIDTKINNSGVDDGVKETGNAIKKLVTVVGHLFDKNDKIDKFNSKLAKATEAVNKQKAEVKSLEQAYNQLLSGEKEPKSLTAMQKELDKTVKQLDAADKNVEKLGSDYHAIEARGVPTNSGGVIYSDGDKSALKQIGADFDSAVDSADVLRNKVGQLEIQISSIRTDPQNSEESQKYATKIELAKQKLARLSEEENIASKNAKKLGSTGAKAMKSTKNATDSAVTAVQRFSKRIFSLIRSALIFSVITKAFTKLREAFGHLLTSDKQMSSLFSQIKSNLLTAFAPIYYYVLPAIKTLMQWLAKLTASIAYLVGGIFGKSVSQSQQMAKQMYMQSQQTDKATSSVNKNTKSLIENAEASQNSVASFDKLNDITESKATASIPDTLVPDDGSAPSVAVAPEFNLDDMDTAQFETLKEKLKDILWYVGAIGAGLLAWKIASVFTSDLKKIGGIAMTVVGIIGLIKFYSDAWVNGIDWKNFLGILGFVVLAVVGIGLAFGLIAAGIALVVFGIAMIVLGIKDVFENGINLKNSLMILFGIIAVGVGLAIATTSLIPLAIAAIAAAVIALVLLILKNWEKVKVWSKFIFEMIGYYWNMMLYGLEVAGVSTVNFLIGIFNGFLNIVNDIINSIISGLNKIPGVNISTVSFQVATLNMPDKPVKPKVPKLATGAVIPANSEFLAILGDQKRGRNLEAPEGLIRNIVREESNSINREDMITAIFSAIKMAKDAGLLASDIFMDGYKVGKQSAKGVGDEMNRSSFVLRTARG